MERTYRYYTQRIKRGMKRRGQFNSKGCRKHRVLKMEEKGKRKRVTS